MRTPPQILICDDDASDVVILSLAFRQAAPRCELLHFPAPQELLDHLHACIADQANLSSLPKLIITDIHMRTGDGIDLIEQIRSNRVLTQIPVIVLTGSINPGDRERAAAAGAATVLPKTADIQELRLLASDLCQRYVPQ